MSDWEGLYLPANSYTKILTSIRTRYPSSDLSKLQRIFGWMIFSRGNRRIRKYELRLGMALSTDAPYLDGDTRPFPNALDICKPLIEDGPGASMVFIHSTVSE